MSRHLNLKLGNANDKEKEPTSEDHGVTLVWSFAMLLGVDCELFVVESSNDNQRQRANSVAWDRHDRNGAVVTHLHCLLACRMYTVLLLYGTRAKAETIGYSRVTWDHELHTCLFSTFDCNEFLATTGSGDA
jgi:hypothetical protein